MDSRSSTPTPPPHLTDPAFCGYLSQIGGTPQTKCDGKHTFRHVANSEDTGVNPLISGGRNRKQNTCTGLRFFVFQYWFMYGSLPETLCSGYKVSLSNPPKERSPCRNQLKHGWLFQDQTKGTPPFTSCNVQVYNVRISTQE